MRQTSRMLILFAFSVLVFVGCNSGGGVPAPPQDASVIDETVAGWTFGAADLVAAVYAPSTYEEIELARGSIDTGGQMNLTLPATIGEDLLYDLVLGDFEFSPCADSVTISPIDARINGVGELLVEQNGVPVTPLSQGEFTYSNTGLYTRWVQRDYVDVAVNMVGTCTVTDEYGTFSVTFDFHAAQGWNLTEVTDNLTCTPSSCTEAITIRTVTYTDLPWEFFSYGGFQMQSENRSAFNDLPLTRWWKR